MAKQPTSMDGFVPRRPNRRVGGAIAGQKPVDQPKPRELNASPAAMPKRGVIKRSEIDESLRGIDDTETSSPRKNRATPVQKSNRRKWIKRIAILLLVILIGIGAYVGLKAISASNNVFKGNIFEVFQNVPLKQDSNGRSNILIVGTSEDDPGHEGGSLTDSMMVMSVDQNKKNAFLISIPRDLYVKYGEACNSGYAGKINEYYNCVHDGTGVDADRAALTKESGFVGGIMGLDIQSCVKWSMLSVVVLLLRLKAEILVDRWIVTSTGSVVWVTEKLVGLKY
jgi:hypothetical protein